ncbi:DUF1566 domain-containing protein [Microbulbifer elongatus]|uniref:DUF1566 domain-containing protein n=1 Tax=Microbulbifer elongatus TaxID=86173 RepID=A0ABT1NX84_9GAMM|nr:DUF1566 domain-containing protein [Microbulbifer elongatus]
MKRWQRSLILFFIPSSVLLGAALLQPQAPTPIRHHFTKIDATGTPLPAWAGPWACVCDHRTGLLWEVKTDSENIHDGLWTYSWYAEPRNKAASTPAAGAFVTASAENDPQPLGTPNQGDCYFEKERCDTADLIRRTRSEQLCGEQHWRLPTSAELKTLVYTDAKAGQPTIDTAFFPKTKRGDYWTSEQGRGLQNVYNYLNTGAVAISFVDGQTITIPHRNAAFVRLVSENSKSCH